MLYFLYLCYIMFMLCVYYFVYMCILYFRWKMAHEHIIEAKFTRQAIEKFVQTSKIELRLVG